MSRVVKFLLAPTKPTRVIYDVERLTDRGTSFIVCEEFPAIWRKPIQLEVLHLVWQSGVRSWKKRFFRFQNNLKSGVYPASLESLWFTVVIVTAIHFAGYKVPYDLVGKVAPYLSGSSISAHLAGSFVVGLCLWLIVIYAIRYTLKLLLMYKGWMYESRAYAVQFPRITATIAATYGRGHYETVSAERSAVTRQ
ncbi:hypothetical protein KM043_017328 [Ampulex compressa]|nr:hypothetical protein KM043_017328 [Ampulex compressa]